jgi:hypothetical protein
MIKPVHDDIPVLQFYFAGSRPATTMLAAAPPWTHRLVDQSPLRDARSAYRDRSTEFATPAPASQTGGQCTSATHPRHRNPHSV